MGSLRNRILFAIATLIAVFGQLALPALAGDTILSNNSGEESAVFFIKDEPSLVINGFDLTPLGLTLPTALDAVSISVDAPVPGSSIDLVVYQDANGGSPVDATLLRRQQVALEQTGINRIALDEAVIITEPVIWVGFYLPVDFRFHADQSGSSVLTYWAWTPASIIDLASLGNAGVLGPGDGSEPVGIEMDGIARITAELRSPQLEEVASAFPLGQQIVANVVQDTSIMRTYEDCNQVLYDPQDNSISYDKSFALHCREAHAFEAPHRIADQTGQALDVQRGSQMYKIWTHLREEQLEEGRVSQLPVRVTHCLRVPAEHLDVAVLGEVREHELVGEMWYVLPTVRFNNLLCAEVSVAHYLSYFVPRAPESAPEVNLVLGWSRVDPHPLTCGISTMVYAPIVNTGRSWFDTESGHVKVTVEDFHVATGVPTLKYEQLVPTDQFGPGLRRVVALGPIYLYDFQQELHRMRVQVDVDNAVAETNESDNVWFTEYVMAIPPGQISCAPPFGSDAPPPTACRAEVMGVSTDSSNIPNEVQVAYAGRCGPNVSGTPAEFLQGTNIVRIRDKGWTCDIGVDLSENNSVLHIQYYVHSDGDCGTNDNTDPIRHAKVEGENIVRIYVGGWR
ncbi:MAG: hypothetical protein OXG85_04060 [Chloroflexi bacterium]|nr:hypothetical protein [Chloroflexota bacterium]